MAGTPVTGASPVTFISEDTQAGKQYQIPLSLLSFDATGAIDASAWTPHGSLSAKDVALLKSLFASLVAQRFLTKPPS
jgi:hypothetical protein